MQWHAPSAVSHFLLPPYECQPSPLWYTPQQGQHLSRHAPAGSASLRRIQPPLAGAHSGRYRGRLGGPRGGRRCGARLHTSTSQASGGSRRRREQSLAAAVQRAAGREEAAVYGRCLGRNCKTSPACKEWRRLQCSTSATAAGPPLASPRRRAAAGAKQSIRAGNGVLCKHITWMGLGEGIRSTQPGGAAPAALAGWGVHGRRCAMADQHATCQGRQKGMLDNKQHLSTRQRHIPHRPSRHIRAFKGWC